MNVDKITNIVFLAGAGGVGKTSVIEEIRKLEPSVRVMPSITRKVYERMGLTDEKQAMALTSEQREEFQSLIFATYLEETSRFVRENLGHSIVIDRSPFDHVSYKTYILPEMTRTEHENLVGQANKFMSSVYEHTVYTALFPFPVHWATENSSDGMRFSPDGKNYCWHALLSTLLGENEASTHYLEAKTIRGRAYEILKLLVS